MISLKRGQVISCEIKDMAANGMGLARVDDRLVAVSGTVPGDAITCRIVGRKHGLKIAKLQSVDTPSSLRKESICQHFPDCGGCQSIHIDYADQCRLKDQILAQCMATYFPKGLSKLKPIVPAPSPHFYRNKMEFSFGMGDDGIYLGLKKRGQFDAVVPLSQCYLLSEDCGPILATVTALLRPFSPTAWDYHEHDGVFRHLVIRQSKAADAYLLNFVVSCDARETIEAILAPLLEAHPKITSVMMSIQDQISDTTFTQNTTCLYGDGFLTERLGHMDYKISPYSFFQSNSVQATVLYDTVCRLADLSSDDKVLDLYCGTGTIGLYMAKHVAHVTGIEENESAIRDAKENAALNGVSNCEFMLGRVKNCLKFNSFDANVVVVDPPRSGIVPKALRRIIALDAETIVYVSCNPISLCQDLVHFDEAGYSIDEIEAVDMFPNTHHIETVLRLSRNKEA